jgi:hypothetical protein
MDTLSYTGKLTIVTCWCGTVHAVPEELRDYQLRQHRDGHRFSVYCPLGHTYSVAGEGEADKERKLRERAEARLTAARDQLQAEKKSHTATKGQLTKTRKRIGKGVCPCCHRSFTNLGRHMETQHPSFGEGAS